MKKNLSQKIFECYKKFVASTILYSLKSWTDHRSFVAVVFMSGLPTSCRYFPPWLANGFVVHTQDADSKYLLREMIDILFV